MSSHHLNQMMSNSVINTTAMNQDMCNQQQANTQPHNMPHQHQQQKSQLLPLLLSPRPTSLKTPDHCDPSGNDHDQIIDQVISLENDYSDPSGTMTNVNDNNGMTMNHHQSQDHLMSDTSNPTNTQCGIDNNQLSSEDLLDLLLEMDRDTSKMVGCTQHLDHDEKVGIETIRKQLMSCDVQSDQQQQQQLLQQNTNSMSPLLNHYISDNGSVGVGHVSHQVRGTQQAHHIAHHNIQSTQQQLISRTAPVISSHQQQQQAQHQLSAPGLSQQQQQQHQHHRLSVDQSLLHGSYSNAHLGGGAVPVSSSGQSYSTQQHQNMNRITQITPMSIDNQSPSPSWQQQPQLSPFSPPQQQHNDPNRPPSQLRQHPSMQQHPATATSPQIQQLHHPLQRHSPSQSISPPVTTEPSPVVKKNPLLNAQLVNSRAPSITPSRFMNNQTNVLNQNPILNSKLSQSSYTIAGGNGSCGGSPLTPNMNSQARFVPEQQSNFDYELSQQHHNAQQHATPQPGYMSIYDHQQQQHHQQQASNQMFRGSPVTTAASSCIPTSGMPHMTIGSTSPGGGGSGGLSQQVKQEIRKKVQQPKQQQHQTTSLLKQLLSDDNK